ncbi:MAG: hypothetical protein ACREO8_03640 [Luteimonas sp.]
MSTVNATNATNASLRDGLQPLDDHGTIAELQLRDQGLGARAVGLEALHGVDDGASGTAATDAGEDVLNAQAWTDVSPGDRWLVGDLGFEVQLGGMALSQAADHAADAVADALI